MAVTYRSLLLWWICTHHFGTGNEICDFNLDIPDIQHQSFTHLQAEYVCDPQNVQNADIIIETLNCLNQTNISGIVVFKIENCNIMDLAENTFYFQMFETVEQIYLRNTGISSLPETIFYSPALINLKELYLDNNQISHVFAKQFIHLTNLTSLSLGNNKLKCLESGMFRSNPISYLDLQQNEISILADDLFEGKVFLTLKHLYLGRNNLTEIPRCLFRSEAIIGLISLDLGYNRITQLPYNIFNSDNKANLATFKLHHNKLKSLPDKFCHFFPNLRIMDLSYNQISSIPRICFLVLRNLVTLHLNNNNINEVSADMLSEQSTNLCDVDLSHNSISSIGHLVPKVLTLRSKYPFPCTLNASYNRITVQETTFIYLSTSKNIDYLNGYLDLSFNNISRFEVSPRMIGEGFPAVPICKSWLITTGNQLFNVENLVKSAIDIDINNINKTRLRELGYLDILRLQTLIQAFPYNYNCNCDMEQYLKLLRMEYFKKAIQIFIKRLETTGMISLFHQGENVFKRMKCGAPIRSNSKYLDDNSVFLQCENTKCTENTHCSCTETHYNDTVRINCIDTNIQHVPEIIHTSPIIEIYAGFNKISQFPLLSAEITMQVTLLDLSFNHLKNIPNSFFSHYPNLTNLNLAGNLFVILPSQTTWQNMNSLKQVQLAGNKFLCNCLGLELKEMLISLQTKIKDFNNIKCFAPSHVKNKVISILADSSFGCFFINLTLILTLSLSFLLFVLVVLFVGYVFRYYVSLFLFIHCGWRFCYNYTKGKTLYDVFISYSAKDSDWVIDQLMNPLENLDPPYNVCLHERDFLIGVPICDNISKAIEGSKCTICVVSKNWLESGWCQFEFRVAHCLATVEKRISLLVILKEEIPKNKISGDLKFYMRTFTYLDAAQPLFWSRLLNDLPKPDGDETIEANDERDAIELI